MISGFIGVLLAYPAVPFLSSDLSVTLFHLHQGVMSVVLRSYRSGEVFSTDHLPRAVLSSALFYSMLSFFSRDLL